MVNKKTWGILICMLGLGSLSLLSCGSPIPSQAENETRPTKAVVISSTDLPSPTPLASLPVESTLAAPNRSSTELIQIISGTQPSQTASDFTYIGKLDSHIQKLLIDFLKGNDLHQAAAREGITASGARILVDIYVKGNVALAENCLSPLGMDIKAGNDANHVIEGLLPVEAVLRAAQCEEVKAILAVAGFGTNH